MEYFASRTPLTLDLPRVPNVRSSKCRAKLTRCWHWSDSARVFAPWVCDGVEVLKLNQDVKQNPAIAAVIE
jgi:hypothetical protein